MSITEKVRKKNIQKKSIKSAPKSITEKSVEKAQLQGKVIMLNE